MAIKFKKFPKSDTKTTTTRVGDHLIEVTTTVEVNDAIIEFEEVADSVEIEPDDHYETPWEHCDGYDHEVVRYPDDEDYPNWRDRQGYTWLDGERRHGLIIPKEDARDSEAWARDWGCSKQVARELAATDRRRTLKALKNWYANGWEWWYAKCEFKGEEASCGGIDDYGYADSEVRVELALEVAAALEKRGYEVTNKPTPPGRYTHADRRRQWKRNVCRGNVDEGDTKFNLGSYPGKFGQWYEKIAQKEKV